MRVRRWRSSGEEGGLGVGGLLQWVTLICPCSGLLPEGFLSRVMRKESGSSP